MEAIKDIGETEKGRKDNEVEDVRFQEKLMAKCMVADTTH